MPYYIAMLRGINVSGQKKIKMADLKSLFEESGFSNVRTYIQSGNVIFEYRSASTDKLAEIISKQIQNAFGFEVPVIVLTASELTNAAAGSPFISNSSNIPERIYFTFLEDEPAKEKVSNLEGIDFGTEEFQKKNKVIYLYIPDGYGRAKLNNNFIENKLKVRATTRNWKTVNKLLEMVSK